MTYKVKLSKQALKDLQRLKSVSLSEKVLKIRDILACDPYQLPYEKLVGNLKGKYSRRINLRHRLVYEIIEDIKVVKILRMWTHYE